MGGLTSMYCTYVYILCYIYIYYTILYIIIYIYTYIYIYYPPLQQTNWQLHHPDCPPDRPPIIISPDSPALGSSRNFLKLSIGCGKHCHGDASIKWRSVKGPPLKVKACYLSFILTQASLAKPGDCGALTTSSISSQSLQLVKPWLCYCCWNNTCIINERWSMFKLSFMFKYIRVSFGSASSSCSVSFLLSLYVWQGLVKALAETGEMAWTFSVTGPWRAIHSFPTSASEWHTVSLVLRAVAKTTQMVWQKECTKHSACKIH